MTLSLHLYRLFTRIAALFAPFIFKWRTAKGKEIAARYNERIARALPERNSGPLIWLHGASLGECKLLLSLAAELRNTHPDAILLFTSQTLSAAELVEAHLPGRALHQMLPLDAPATAQRFIAHWKPALCIFAEGEVWPNLLSAAKQTGSQTALINARMRTASLERWSKAGRSARHVFSQFDAIIAADDKTASGLSTLLDREIANPGNLKAALIAPRPTNAEPQETDAWRTSAHVSQIILGASTHAGEEQLLLDAMKKMPQTARLIIAPRHPARAEEIERTIKAAGLAYTRRSTGGEITPDTQVLLADTFGEMDLWYASADAAYLGGSLTEGIGGHSPLEPLQFGLPIATGRYTENFSGIHGDLTRRGWIEMADTPEQLARFFQTPPVLSRPDIEAYFAGSMNALEETLAALSNLLHTDT